MNRSVAAIALAGLGCIACLDVTPSTERGRMSLLAPPAARAAIEAMLSNFSPLGTALPPAPSYLEVGEMLRRLDEDDRVGVVVTFDDAIVQNLSARRRLVERARIADARLVVVGNVVAADIAALAAMDLAVAVPERNAGVVGGRAFDALVRYGALTRMRPYLRTTRGSEESLALLQAGQVQAAILLAPEAFGAGLQPLFAFDPGVDDPVALQVLLLHEEHADARPLFDHLRSQAALATFVTQGWSAPR